MTVWFVSVGRVCEVEWVEEMLPDEVCQGQMVQWLRCQAGYLVIVDAGRGGRMGPWMVFGRRSCKSSRPLFQRADDADEA